MFDVCSLSSPEHANQGIVEEVITVHVGWRDSRGESPQRHLIVQHRCGENVLNAFTAAPGNSHTLSTYDTARTSIVTPRAEIKSELSPGILRSWPSAPRTSPPTRCPSTTSSRWPVH